MSFGPWVLIIFLGLNGHLKIEGIKSHHICQEMLHGLIPLTAYKKEGSHVGGACYSKARITVSPRVIEKALEGDD